MLVIFPIFKTSTFQFQGGRELCRLFGVPIALSVFAPGGKEFLQHTNLVFPSSGFLISAAEFLTFKISLMIRLLVVWLATIGFVSRGIKNKVHRLLPSLLNDQYNYTIEGFSIYFQIKR